jgi:predicted O-methyltransferase YrrM
MKNDCLSSLPIDPEEFDTENYRKQKEYPHSELKSPERHFVHGLIRYFEPKNLIEVGVSRGGSTVLLLNSIMDRPDSTLTSIDIAEVFYGDKTTPVGQIAKDTYPDLPEGKWDLITGKDPVEVIEGLDKKYDLAILDTAHALPGEVLNFLTILPYLNDGAIVFLHDITEYYNIFMRNNFATRLLNISVAAPKLYPNKYIFKMYAQRFNQPNLCAFQITPDTRKYISNVFNALKMPWVLSQDKATQETFQSFFARHFGDEYAEIYKDACAIQSVLKINFKDRMDEYVGDRDFCLFGAGHVAEHVVRKCKEIGRLPIYYLDNNPALTERTYYDVTLKVYPPDKNPNKNALIIVTPKETDGIYEQLSSLGYRRGENVLGIDDIVATSI